MADTAKVSLKNLFSFCNNHNWIGYDPFDGLNSRVFHLLFDLKSQRIFRLAFIQLNKILPINIRPFFIIKKGRNPKGIGLFLDSIASLYKKTRDDKYLILMKNFANWLKEDVSAGYSGHCWGYNFDWQSRAFFLPKGTPTVVNTSFIGRSFLNVYEVTGNEEYLRIARSSCDFILEDLNRYEENNTVCFSYSPIDSYFVYNATALASSLLGSVYSKTKENGLAEEAKKSIQYIINHQNENGSWNYGESKTAKRVGIDNFHTGFILESLKIYTETTGDNDYIDHLKKGLLFYQDYFFLENGAPKYYYNKKHPFDIHSASQAIVTLLQLKNYGADQVLCGKVIKWMIRNMQDKKGYFYYQKRRLFTNKIPYMRWSQAWAFHALTSYLVSNE